METNSAPHLREIFGKLVDSVVPQSEAAAFLSEVCGRWQEIGPDFLLEIKNSLRYAEALTGLLREIHRENDAEKLLASILDTAIDLTGAERGFILLRDLEVARHFDGEDIVGDYKISRSLADSVWRIGKPVITEDAQSDRRFVQYQSVYKYRACSILCVPIAVRDKIFGVLYLDNRMVRSRFHPSHLKELSVFAEQAGIALENARMCREIALQSQKLRLLNVKLQRRHGRPEAPELSREQLQTLQNQHCYLDLCGRSPKMQEIFCTIEKIKDYDIAVLIQGESGTGKELVARAIHAASRLRDRPFICENCAAIPESLFESELFGHEKGAFTGASQVKKGLLEQAHGGALFLDEIGELSLEIQKKLLRILAEKKVRRVGGYEAIPVEVRIIAATNRNLRQMIEQGQFREDLYYRLNGIAIELPPLRERREDIPLLVDRFLKEIGTGGPKKIERGLLSILLSYNWPGNIRQLRNEIQRLFALSGNVLEARYLSPEILPPCAPKTDDKIHNLPDLLYEVEKKEILKAMEHCEHNKSRASQLLGISRFTLQRKLEKYGM